MSSDDVTGSGLSDRNHERTLLQKISEFVGNGFTSAVKTSDVQSSRVHRSGLDVTTVRTSRGERSMATNSDIS